MLYVLDREEVEEILNRLKQRGTMTVEEIAEGMSISVEDVRCALAELGGEGIVVREVIPGTPSQEVWRGRNAKEDCLNSAAWVLMLVILVPIIWLSDAVSFGRSWIVRSER